jgi:hypothetical protein
MAARIFPDTSTVLKLRAPVQERHYQFERMLYELLNTWSANIPIVSRLSLHRKKLAIRSKEEVAIRQPNSKKC